MEAADGRHSIVNLRAGKGALFMLSRRIFATLVFIALSAIPTALAQAQSGEAAGGWGRARRALDAQTLQSRARSHELRAEAEDQAPPLAGREIGANGLIEVIERAREARRLALVGTWRINISQSTGGLPPFKSFYTFHLGGTFFEVTDLIGKLNEGPSQGVWDWDGAKYNVTFELFVFDEKKDPAGVVRVRLALHLVNHHEIQGEATVDFIDPDGNLFTDIDGATFTGKRMQIIPAR
jgi:hypothetical protein